MYYIPNVDTIYFLVSFENYEESSNIKKLLSHLKEEKEKALLAGTNNASYKHTITLNDMSFELLHSGTCGYAYIIRNNGYEIKIAQFISSIKSFAPVQVRISAEYLWSQGLEKSYKIIYNWLVETFDNIREVKISRVDLACHISDADFVTNYSNCYKGNSKKGQLTITNKDINCITFGSRKSGIYCRIYNKTLEIKETGNKYWFFDIWQSKNMNIDNVWNVEFEIKSELLRKYNIVSIRDLLEHITALWKYCTTEWLVKIDRTNTRVERCNTNELWQIIQNAYNGFSSCELIEREKQINTDASQMIPAITGYITTYGAMIGETNIDMVLSKLKKESSLYLAKKNTDVRSVIVDKMPRIYDCEVNKND